MRPFTIAALNGSNRLTIDLEHLVAVGGPTLGYQRGWYTEVKLFFMFRDEPISVWQAVPNGEASYDGDKAVVLCVDGKWRDEVDMIHGKPPSPAKAVERVAAETVVPLELAWKEVQS